MLILVVLSVGCVAALSPPPTVFTSSITPHTNTYAECTIMWEVSPLATSYKLYSRRLADETEGYTEDGYFRLVEEYAQPGGATAGTVLTSISHSLVGGGLFEIAVVAHDATEQSDASSVLIRPLLSDVPGSDRSVLRLDQITSNTATLAFHNPSADRYDIVGCTVAGDSSSCNTASPLAAGVTSTDTFTLTALSAGTTYNLRLLAGNSVGYQTASDATELTITTTSSMDNTPVLGLRILGTSDSHVTVQFAAQPTHTRFTLLTSENALELSAIAPSANIYEAVLQVGSAVAGMSTYASDFTANRPDRAAELIEATFEGLPPERVATICVLPGNNHGYADAETGTSCMHIQPTTHAPASHLPLVSTMVTRAATTARVWRVETDSITLWHSHPAAVSFEILISSDGTTFDTAVTETGSRYTLLSSLTPETMYWFQVRALNPYGQAEGFAQVNATTTSAVPQSRVSSLRVLSVSHGSMAVTLQWEELPDATHYQVFIATTLIGSTQSNFLTFDSPASESQYDVYGVNNYGSATAFSSITVTPTDAKPAEPIVFGRIADVQATSATVVWLRPYDTTYVRVLLREASSMSEFRVVSTQAAPSDLSGTDTSWQPAKTELGTADYPSFTIAGLSELVEYQVLLVAGNEHGEAYGGATIGQMGGLMLAVIPTQSAPAAPVDDLVVLGIASTSVDLRWMGVSSATFYRVFVREFSLTPGAYSEASAAPPPSITANHTAIVTYTVTGLNANTDYEIQVRPSNVHGTQSELLAATVRAKTSTSLASPAVTSLAVDSLSDNSVSLVWESDPTAFFHSIDLVSATRSPDLSDWEVVDSYVLRGEQSQTVAYTVSGLSPAERYIIRVRGGNNAGIESAGTIGQMISVKPGNSTPPPPAALLIVGLSSTSADLQWEGVPEAFKYMVTLETAITGLSTLSNDFRFSDTTVNSGTVSTFPATGLNSANGPHTFTVYAGNSHGFETTGASYTITPTDSQPPAPTIISVSQYRSVATIQWDKVNEAFAYDLDIADADDEVFASLAVGIVDTEYRMQLEANTTRVVKVKSRNSAGILQESGTDAGIISDVIVVPTNKTEITLIGAQVFIDGQSSITVD